MYVHKMTIMQKCPICGRFMKNEFDGENIISTCSFCNDELIVNDKATDRMWDEIDKQRIKDNPVWELELLSLAPEVIRTR